MTGAGGGLGAWGRLVLLGLCVWTGAKAAAPKAAVRNLNVWHQTSSSITLRWDPPEDPTLQNYTYWVRCTGDGGKNETGSTTDVTYTAEGLEPASRYELSVWVEGGGASSSEATLSASTAPNPISKLTVESQTNISITLRWEAPDPQSYTYWVRCTGDDGKNETRNTTDVTYTVQGLTPATSYLFSVWAEKHGVPSSVQTQAGSTVPNPVRDLTGESQTTSSISLRWGPPHGPDQNYTYWVSWTMEGGVTTGTRNTPDTRVTVDAMKAGTLYTFTVWAERNGVSSSKETLMGATAPNEVTALQKETQTNNSIALRWKAPADPRYQLYIYCVRWAGGGPPQGEGDPQAHQVDQIARTKETWYVVKGLEPGTPYNFSVWAERSDVAGATQSLRASTYPDPVTIISCISISGGYGVTLTWTCPRGGYEAFQLHVGGQLVSWDRASCGKDRGMSVSNLQPAQSYPATVKTVWDGLRAPAASVTCHTESAGVIAGAVVGVLLFLTLVGLLIFFLRRYKKSLEEAALR